MDHFNMTYQALRYIKNYKSIKLKDIQDKIKVLHKSEFHKSKFYIQIKKQSFLIWMKL